MLILPNDHSDPLVIGVGHHRACYIHPQDASKCIKVIYNPSDRASQETQREISYYEHLEKYLKDWRGLPKYYGQVQTNLGLGYIYDRIVDFDGQPSQTMEQRYVKNSSSDQRSEMEKLIVDLKNYLRENHIVTMSLKPYNILCHRLSETSVFPVICDNIGTASYIPLEIYCPWLCHQKQKRQFARFDKLIRSQFNL